MKKLFTLLTLLAVTAVACNEDNERPLAQPDTSQSTFTLLSESVLEYEAEGGHGKIQYTIENPVEGALVLPTVDVDWVTDFYVTSSEISFYVEASTVEEPREATIIVAYGQSKSFVVGIRQKAYVPNEVTLNDCLLNGSFEGRDIGAGTIFNYVVSFTDNGLKGADDSQTSSYLYRFNIYSERLHGLVEDAVPNGEYSLDVRNRGKKDSFMADGSFYKLFGEEGYTVEFTSGTVTVTDDGIHVVAETEDGRTHEINYTGSKKLSYIDAVEKTHSTLTDNFSFDKDNVYIRCHYYGDYYGLGYDNWSISFIEDNRSFSGLYIVFNILIDKSLGYVPDAFLGEYQAYTLDRGTNYASTFIPGTRRGYSSYSWLVECEEGFFDYSLEPSSPLASGVIRFTKEDNTYTIEYDCKDDKGFDIKGTVRANGIGEIYDVRDPEHPKSGF